MTEVITSNKGENDPRLAKLREKQAEVLGSMENHAIAQLDLLKDVETNWQPSDFLPDPASEDFLEQIAALRERAKAIPDDVLITLVGDMITEEALPSYQTMFNRFRGAGDSTGVDENPWAKWSRGWTAEENRHGDVLKTFLYLSGRVDMRSIEITIQNLIRNGFDLGNDGDPYQGFVYTSFQERATKISHSNVANLSKAAGLSSLTKMCVVIAGDEARHEEGYKRFMDKIFELDPEGALDAFYQMMKRTIQMPARLMEDGVDPNLFRNFERVAQRIGVYTAQDYTTIIDHLVKRWKIADLKGLSGEAAKAQDYLGGLAERYRKLAARMEEKVHASGPTPFAWIFGRAV
jgi:acyl-[acyl-carrier-protein] desaturase